MTCTCGIDQETCHREQQREQSGDSCGDRLAVLGITVCPDCGEPTHASESDDTGRCASCRACYWCDEEATRTGIWRNIDDEPNTRQCCEVCGASSDRIERRRKHDIESEKI